MKRMFFFAVLFASCLSITAKTPQAVKASLDSIAPPDSIIKAAYLKDGTGANFARDATKSNVYVVSSEDGIIRKVNTVTGNLIMVNITKDGRRVLYHDRATSYSYVVNWDGTNEKVFAKTGFLIEYWRDKTAGTDWAVMENTSGQYRINIDSPTNTVQLSPYGVSSLSGGLSDDGTRIVVYDNGWGTAAVGSSSVQKGSGGCQASMRAGPIAQWSCNVSGHEKSFINNPDGTVAFQIVMGVGFTGEGARFTQHPNFFSFMQASYDPASGLGQPEARNPTILRVSDNRKITIDDGIPRTTWCGDVDAVLLPNSASKILNKSSGKSLNRKTNGLFESFSIDGRRVGRNVTKGAMCRGVVVAKYRGAGCALVREMHF